MGWSVYDMSSEVPSRPVVSISDVTGNNLIENDPARSRGRFIRHSIVPIHTIQLHARDPIAGLHAPFPRPFGLAALRQTRSGCRPDISFSRRHLDLQCSSAFLGPSTAAKMIT